MTKLSSLIEDFKQTLSNLAAVGEKYNFSANDIVATDGGRLICRLTLKDGRVLILLRNSPTGKWECIGDAKEFSMAHESIFENCSLKLILEKQSEFSKLEKNKVPLTPEERAEVFKQDAVWHYGYSIDPNTGEKVQKVSAVWKSKDPKTGEITYITNTHRAWNKAPTLKGAISRYHKFIKGTA